MSFPLSSASARPVRPPSLIVATMIITLLPSCARRVPDGLLTSHDKSVETCARRGSSTVKLTYLGVGGFLLEHGDDLVLTSPFFSNPGILRVGLGLSIRPDAERIDRGLEMHVPGVDSVDAILVGHSHYDHLMDLPYIGDTWIREGTVYGNETMAHLLASSGIAGRLRTLNDLAGDDQEAGEWIHTGGGTRIMALRSSHAPQFLGIDLFEGKVLRNSPSLPRSAYGWKGGQTFAFAIDLLEGQPSKEAAGDPPMPSPPVAFRIHYQDAASAPPSGFPPDEVLRERRVDVAIVTVAGFAEVDGYPEEIIRTLHPRHVVLGHWEDFFRDPAKAQKVVRWTKLSEFIDRMEKALPKDAAWTLPKPGVTMAFNVCADGDPVHAQLPDRDDRR